MTDSSEHSVDPNPVSDTDTASGFPFAERLRGLLGRRGGGTETPPLSNAALRTRQKRLGALTVLAAALLSIGAVSSVDSPEPPTRRAPDETTKVDLTLAPDRTQRERYFLEFEKDFSKLESEVGRLKKEAAERERRDAAETKALRSENATLKEDLERLNEELVAAKNNAASTERTLADLRERVEKDDAGDRRRPRLANGTNGAFGTETLPPDARFAGSGGLRSGFPPAAGGSGNTDGTRTARSGLSILRMPEPVKDEKHAGASAPAAPAPFVERDSPIALNRAAGRTVETYLPPGTFTTGTLLTGGLVATGGGSEGRPMPVLLQVEDTAFLPNNWLSDVRDCRVTGSASGDLSTERVQVRLDRLSCAGPDGEALDVRVYGYAVGADGRVGVKGKLVTKSGQAIANALKLSLLSGFGKAVALSAEEVQTSITGTQTHTYENAWKAGLGQGLSGGMDRLVAYYLKLADKVMPVLEMNPGQRVDIVFSQGVHLAADPR